jgi:hypothetical protein
MPKVRAFWIRLCGIFNPRRNEGDIRRRTRSHVAMHTEDGIRAGLSPEEARRQALIRLGGAEQTRQAFASAAACPGLNRSCRTFDLGCACYTGTPAIRPSRF